MTTTFDNTSVVQWYCSRQSKPPKAINTLPTTVKPTMLSVAALVLAGAATGIQPVEVDNVTVRVELNVSEIYRSGAQTTPGEYAPSSYPYLSSSKPEALVPYGDTTELTNIYMPDGLVAYYPLDETTGNTANDITTALPDNDGTHISLNQDNLGARGNISTAYKFDGNNDYVNVPEFNWDGGPVTVSFWNYVESADVQESSAFGTDGGSSNRFQAHVPWSNRNIYWDYGDFRGDGRIFTDYSDYLGEWTHVTLISEGADGNFKAIYLNAEQVASGQSSDGPGTTQMFHIGHRAAINIGSRHHPGKLDEFRIYNRSLSQEEVQRLYNYQNNDQPGTEQISATITSGGFILANTKGGTPSIESRSEAVGSRAFLNRVSPSFGFSQSKTPPTTQATYRSPYNLTGDSFSTTSSSIELKSVPEIGDNATVLVAPTD